MAEKTWWPSRYGPGDEIGALNEIRPQNTVSAARLVRSGKVYDLGRILDEHTPAFPGRTFKQTLVTSAHILNKRRGRGGAGEGWGRNQVNWITELVYGTFQVGTQLCGLNHLQIGGRCYNGFSVDEIAEEWGTNKLGIETVPQIVSRGVLLDIAAARGVPRLEKGYVITVRDAESALWAASLKVERGDAVLFHTGWGELWMEDNASYLSGEPGPGLDVVRWLVDQGVALTGCDTWSFGPVPPEDAEEPFVVPQTLNVRHGVFVLENLFTAELASNGVHEFMFVVGHARVRGATAAWVSPLAIV